MTPQEQLCEKMRVEQSAYCLWLTAQPPEEILHHAYEYSVREDIILATEEMNLTPAQVRALLKSPAPLADVYKDFSKLETDYMSIVAQCVEDRADDLLKKEQQQNPPKVYRQSVTYAREHGELQQYHLSHRGQPHQGSHRADRRACQERQRPVHGLGVQEPVFYSL